MTTSKPRDIAALDRPASEVAADVKALITRQRCQVLADAAKRTASPSDRIAYALDAELLQHPEALAVTVPAGWDHHIAQLAKLNGLHREAAEFNARYPVGTPVNAYPGCRPEYGPGERIETVTRSRASVLSGHTAVVWVEGHSACIALSHIDIRPGGAS
ncbi:hypothetical protein ACFVTY_01870 [Streptomyces sp. NPDC058067]|uniref:hypothetical protein n=1 Tax=Streptomyces sp. NPDC058067 TaxID=3346324 RepID=UPI0036E24A30